MTTASNTLADIFSDFDGTQAKDTEQLSELFRPIAEELICNGHFVINNQRKIFLTDLEFYYHEENGAKTIDNRPLIKDPIMYHTYEHEKNVKAIEKEASTLPDDNKDLAVPYFQAGSLNLHNSGIDITFENQEKKYRASVLIRGYEVEGESEEHRSTYIYEAMFMNITLPMSIEWAAEQNPNHQVFKERFTRQNVAAYDENNIKIAGSKGSPESFSSNGKYYKQCQRKWRFKRA